ncbi:hypothetical protein AB0N09_30970 [Streptomyces erythrochromogenes]|uniref:hypothetical protein n=1 Tax=Streptomyces erythrochromogenes TaxID=285574 RepID=UPI00342F34C6
MSKDPFQADPLDEPNPFGGADDEPAATAEEAAQHFVRVWAEAVIRQATRTRAIRRKSAVDDRNFERNEGWSPTEDDLYDNDRVRWAEEHTLVWSAHQLERWRARLAKERGQAALPKNQDLEEVRNVLEHLDEVDLQDWTATPPAGQKRIGRSLRNLPDQMLSLGGFDGRTLFQVLDSERIADAALEVVKSVEAELAERERDMVEAYLELRD